MALRYAILTLLARESFSGYDLISYFDGSVGFVWHATHPQIYRELQRLRRSKSVVDRVVVQRGRPNKRVYSITAAGERDLIDWVTTPASPEIIKDDMLLRVFSYGLIAPEAAIERLGEYRATHERRLGRYREIAAALANTADDGFRLGSELTLQSGILHEEAYVRWASWATGVLRRRRHTGAPARRRRRPASKRVPP